MSRSVIANTVVLNGVTFPIEGDIDIQPVKPFSAALGSGNIPERKDLGPASTITWEEFQGLGIQYTDGRSNMDRHWDGVVDTTPGSYLMLPPLVTSYTTRDVGKVYKIIKHQGIKFALTDIGLLQFVSSDWSAAASNIAQTFVDATISGPDMYLIGPSYFYRFGDYAASNPWTALTPSVVPNRAILDFDGNLLGLYYNSSTLTFGVYKYTTSGTVSALLFNIPETLGTVLGFVSWVNAAGAPTPVIVTPDARIYLDIDSHKYYKVPVAGAVYTGLVTGLSQPAIHAGNLILCTSYGSLLSVTPNGIVTNIGLSTDDGLPATRALDIHAVASSGAAMYAVQKAGTAKYAGLYFSRGVHWHRLYESGTAAMALYAPFWDAGVLYWFEALAGGTYGNIVGKSALWTETQRDKFTSGVTLTMAATGTWVSPIFNGGFSEFGSIALALAAITEALTATETLVLAYDINQSGSWTTLVTLTSNTNVAQLFSSGLGLAFNEIQFKLTLSRRTTSTPGSVTYTGDGINDMTVGGAFTGLTTVNYWVKIYSTGTPDTALWSKDGGSTWESPALSLTGTAQALNNGVTVTFGATTGHSVIDLWKFTCTAVDTTPTPKVKALVFKFWPNPTQVYRYTFTVACLDNILRNTDAATLAAALDTATQATTFLNFYPDGDVTGTAKKVKVIEQTGRLTWSDLRQHKAGKYRITVTEA